MAGVILSISFEEINHPDGIEAKALDLNIRQKQKGKWNSLYFVQQA